MRRGVLFIGVTVLMAAVVFFVLRGFALMPARQSFGHVEKTPLLEGKGGIALLRVVWVQDQGVSVYVAPPVRLFSSFQECARVHGEKSIVREEGEEATLFEGCLPLEVAVDRRFHTYMISLDEEFSGARFSIIKRYGPFSGHTLAEKALMKTCPRDVKGKRVTYCLGSRYILNIPPSA